MAIFYYHMVKFNGVFSVKTSASIRSGSIYVPDMYHSE